MCTHVLCMCVYVCVFARGYAGMCIHICPYVCIYDCLYASSTRTHTHTRTRTRTHTHIHAHTHTHTHTHTPSNRPDVERKIAIHRTAEQVFRDTPLHHHRAYGCYEIVGWYTHFDGRCGTECCAQKPCCVCCLQENYLYEKRVMNEMYKRDNGR